MDIPESKLQEFESTLKEIRSIVLNDFSLFADTAFRRATRWLAFGFGVAIALFCAFGYFEHSQGTWFLFTGGLISLFVIENSPWIWGGILWAGAFFTLGIASLLYSRKK